MEPGGYLIFAWCPSGKKKEGKTSKLVDEGSNNWNEREGNNQYGKDRHGGRMDKKNKLKL